MKKRFFLAAMTLLVSMGASAQGNGIGGITEATNMVTSYCLLYTSMAKKIVKVNEEKIRGYMVGDIPDAIENEDIIVVEVPEEERCV